MGIVDQVSLSNSVCWEDRVWLLPNLANVPALASNHAIISGLANEILIWYISLALGDSSGGNGWI